MLLVERICRISDSLKLFLKFPKALLTLLRIGIFRVVNIFICNLKLNLIDLIVIEKLQTSDSRK